VLKNTIEIGKKKSLYQEILELIHNAPKRHINLIAHSIIQFNEYTCIFNVRFSQSVLIWVKDLLLYALIFCTFPGEARYRLSFTLIIADKGCILIVDKGCVHVSSIFQISLTLNSPKYKHYSLLQNMASLNMLILSKPCSVLAKIGGSHLVYKPSADLEYHWWEKVKSTWYIFVKYHLYFPR
jgi:hypothetical protein